MPRGTVSLILRSFVYVRTGIAIDSEFDCILLILLFYMATGNCQSCIVSRTSFRAWCN